MLYHLSYSYFIFPILCLVPFIRKKKIFLSMYLIIYLGFSKIGSDYNGYLEHFTGLQNGVPLKFIHGEILFKLYMKLFVNLGFSYEFFRSFHLILFLSIICYSLYNISEYYNLSLFVLYCGYIIYLCSAYRQMISMAFILLGIKLMWKNKINLAILLNLFALGFHVSSIYGLLFFILFKIKKRFNFTKISIFFFIFFAILVRFTLGQPIMQTYIYSILNFVNLGTRFLEYSKNIVIFPFGLITRLVSFLPILVFYKKSKKIRDKIFIMYVSSIILYTLIPFELLAGRLFNNGRILECLIFPLVIGQQNKKINKLFLMIFMVVYFLLTLLNQLLKQNGYYPYINILF